MKDNLNHQQFQGLSDRKSLLELDQQFNKWLKKVAPEQADAIHQQRRDPFTGKRLSEFVLTAGVLLQQFILEHFQLTEPFSALKIRLLREQKIASFKRQFIQRYPRRARQQTNDLLDFNALDTQVMALVDTAAPDQEFALVCCVLSLLEEAHAHQEQLTLFTQWVLAIWNTPEAQQRYGTWVSLQWPQKRVADHLVSIEPVPNDDLHRLQSPIALQRQRDGFNLTDEGMGTRAAENQAHYCVYCHQNEGDFCSHGFPVKKGEPELGYKKSDLDQLLVGCPLEEKISEMNWLYAQGEVLAALAVIMIDNPMCPATGHRICNDCMKACIYQKQEPVDIPQIETRILKDVLSLPWGVELYQLLVLWNPMRAKQYLPKSYNGKKVLVMGMGPAGFTLSHHLLMEGFAVVGADGLKIETFNPNLVQAPLESYSDLLEPLSDRVIYGFGGVAEYGITVRWDKNFLKLIQMSLLRRNTFQLYGSVRFGGTMTIEKAWALGFHHVTIAVGAGLPRELLIPNSLAPGMRQANDFLMALQLTGAHKSNSLANLQVRLPAIVVGGGLTGVDTATEVAAYYIRQVEKVGHRYRALCQSIGENQVRSAFTDAEWVVMSEWLRHESCVQQERQQAQQARRAPQFIALIQRWGGVTLVYRRSMQLSPAYRLNSEELAKAMEEGLYYREWVQPEAVVLDETGHVEALRCSEQEVLDDGSLQASGQSVTFPARSIFMATGAKPNVAYEFEHQNTFDRKRFEYLRYALDEGQLQLMTDRGHVKAKKIGPFTSYQQQGRYVSFIGDTHPRFHGSVVKAIASAQRAYPEIVQALDQLSVDADDSYEVFSQRLRHLFHTELLSVERLAPHWLVLTVRAPLAAEQFQPGQFFRLQSYECLSDQQQDTDLQSEAVALIGMRLPQQPSDQLSFLLLENGVSSRLLGRLSPQTPVALMGPTGARSSLPQQGVIVLIGGTMAIAQLFSHLPAWREQGNRIIWVADFRDPEQELFWLDKLSAAIDVILWLGRPSERSQDRSYVMSPAEALLEYAQDTADDCIDLSAVQQVMIVSTACEVKQLGRQRETLKPVMPDAKYIAAVHGPMQCMLKGVCAQCLQWQVDPKTGERTKAVYACSWQNQPLERIDVDHLAERMRLNSIQEKLTNLWFEHIFSA